MPPPLNVIALISGGKDSLFSLLHCISNGHQIVALANLHPPVSSTQLRGSAEADDLNSFMYQTVGHTAIPLIAECLNLPLYRRAIVGSAVDTQQEYDLSRDKAGRHDETEDLLLLLQDVLVRHPEANAVCSGAILSTYQRTRVESVAVRLGLTPLAFLWQYPVLPSDTNQDPSKRVDGLLADMKVAGLEARIIKIASGGIRTSMLWANVTELETRSRMLRGLTPYFDRDLHGLRASIIGEGGEYETFVLDGPGSLWKRNIRFEQSEVQCVDGQGETGYVVLGSGKAVPKESEKHDDLDLGSVPLPSIYDTQFQKLRHRPHHPPPIPTEPMEPATSDTEYEALTVLTPSTISPIASAVSAANLISIANITHPEPSLTAAAQLHEVMTTLKTIIQDSAVNRNVNLSMSNIVFALLIVQSMLDFEAANRTYASSFRQGEPNPPARVTIAASLPTGAKVSLSVVLSTLPRLDSRGLHVQSRSYWAPANIGPYSQAISVPLRSPSDAISNSETQAQMCFVAGQIPLAPSTMEMLPSSFEERAILSLQHLWRIGQERKVDIWPWTIAFLQTAEDVHAKAGFAAEIWRLLHKQSITSDDDDENSSDEGFDVSDLRRPGGQPPMAGISFAGDVLDPLPNLSLLNIAGDRSLVPPIVVAEVVSLPRDAPIEWWSSGITNLMSASSKSMLSFDTTSWNWGSISTMILPYRSPESSGDHGARNIETSFATILISRQVSEPFEEMLHVLRSALPSVTNNRNRVISHGSALTAGGRGLALYDQLSRCFVLGGIAVIPCHHLYGAAPQNDNDQQLSSLNLAMVFRIDEDGQQAAHIDDPAV